MVTGAREVEHPLLETRGRSTLKKKDSVVSGRCLKSKGNKQKDMVIGKGGDSQQLNTRHPRHPPFSPRLRNDAADLMGQKPPRFKSLASTW